VSDWFDRLRRDETIRDIATRLERGGRVAVQGVAGSSTTLVAAALHRTGGRPVLLVVGHLDDADEAVDELTALGIDAAAFPALEFSSGDLSVSPDLVSARLLLLRRLGDPEPPPLIVAPIQALMQRVPGPERLGSMLRVIRLGDHVDATELVRWLDSVGYSRVPSLESPGEFAVRGGIIDVYPPGAFACRIDLFGDEVEGLFEIDLDTMGSDRRLEHIEIIGASAQMLQEEAGTILLVEALGRRTLAVLAEMLELSEQGRSYFERVADPSGIAPPRDVLASIDRHCESVLEVAPPGSAGGTEVAVELPVSPLPVFPESASAAVTDLLGLALEQDVCVLCQNEGEAQRLAELVGEQADTSSIRICTQFLNRGLIWRGRGDGAARPLALVPYQELMNRFQTRRRIRQVSTGRALDTFVDLEPGDFVVHRDHGIAKYLGLRTLEDRKSGAIEEFLTLEFGNRAKLHVPASRIDLVQRYIGAFRGRPELSKLGGKRWRRQKETVQEAVRDLAAEMLRLQAARETLPGVRYPADTTWQVEFDAEFPYEETDDQLAAIVAVKQDMCDPRPMDRLICGDVGFGKTEIAIRAAFKAAEYGKQVAVLVPTTVLAEQHERTFRDRLADYPFRIESLSRFKSRGEQTKILEQVHQGKVDVVIGTHRLLSADVRFADLGLVIIDEEQRFGVEHKQTLLQFRATADVLTLSATPIPRTLHMAMLGLRDISALSTAPLDRRAIVTEVLTYDTQRIRQAIDRELAREGQVFFVHNRVHNIHVVAQDLQQLVPDARIIVGHGQMGARQLESVMLAFIRGDADILVCTTIIESGIDIPTANTMFINDADIFGLSDLHQLRGRVGRYKHRAYCYLLLSPEKVIQPVALKRLRAIEAFSMLGAGFKIALRDLEIRGAGNLLGAEQSGHIAAVGYEMYCQLLQQEVAQLRDPRARAAAIDTTVDLGISGGLPKGYIPSDARRMDAYRRICRANEPAELDKIERDLVSAYGELPAHAQRFIHHAAIRIAGAMIGVQSVRRHEQDIIFLTGRPQELKSRMEGAAGTLRRVGAPDEQGHVELYYRPPPRYLEDDSLLTVLRRRLLGETAEAVRAAASSSSR
jgi:transcription-repair coupling factor (superfamily II helicase)